MDTNALSRCAAPDAAPADVQSISGGGVIRPDNTCLDNCQPAVYSTPKGAPYAFIAEVTRCGVRLKVYISRGFRCPVPCSNQFPPQMLL